MKKLTLLFTLILCFPCFASSFKVLYFFQGGTDGSFPTGLAVGKDGDLYGATSLGGNNVQNCASGGGTIFKLTRTGTKTILYNFTGNADGCSPENALTLGPDGNFYGTTVSGGNTSGCAGFGCGTIFKITPQGDLTTLYAFQGAPNDITWATGPLSFDSQGNLYGVGFGGVNSCGTSVGCGGVFQWSAGGAETILYNFTGPPDGAQPAGPIVILNGVLYGTTEEGGDSTCNPSYGCGAAYSMTLTGGNETILYTFEPSTGRSPTGLIADAAGDLYGTTDEGGSYGSDGGDGVLFALSSGQNGWTESVLHDFGAQHDGVNPAAGLLMDDSGNLFGSTGEGGAGDKGTIFRLNPKDKDKENILHSFVRTHERRAPSGAGPSSGVVSFGKGDLYGTTSGGGNYNCKGGCGVVFRVGR